MKPFFYRRFPLALGALSCALALASCSSPTDDNAAISRTTAEVTSNAMAPNAEDTNAIDDAKVDQNAENAANSNVQFAALETIYVPGKDDLLHATKVSRLAIDSQLKSGDRAAPGLQEIIEKAPQYFPKDAKVNSTTQTEKGVTVDLNRAFADAKFWRTKGEKMTELAAYALVNSAAKTTSAAGTSEPKPVTFTIEKQPAKLLGDFDIDGEIEPEMRLVAGK